MALYLTLPETLIDWANSALGLTLLSGICAYAIYYTFVPIAFYKSNASKAKLQRFVLIFTLPTLMTAFAFGSIVGSVRHDLDNGFWLELTSANSKWAGIVTLGVLGVILLISYIYEGDPEPV